MFPRLQIALGGLVLATSCGRVGFDIVDDGPTVPTHVASANGSLELDTFDAISTDGEIEGISDNLYVAFVSMKRGIRTVDSMSGLGLEWIEVRQHCTGRSTASLAAFWAQGSDPISGPVSAHLGAADETLASAAISVHSYDGVRFEAPLGVVRWANTNGVGSDAACESGSDTTDYSVDMTTTAARSAIVAGVHTASYHTHEPASGTERDDLQSGSSSESAGVAVQDVLVEQPGQHAIGGSFGGDAPDWLVIAVELKALE